MTFRRLAVFFCLISACFAQRTPRKCADVPIKTSDGRTIRVSEYHGKVVMAIMMLTDCPECHAMLDFLSRLQRELGPRGFQGIAVSLDSDADAVKPFAERYRFPFPVGHLDKEGAFKFLDLKATAMPIVPYIVFIDWMGNVRFQYPGDDPIFKQGEKGLAGIANALLRQAQEKKGPTYVTRPAGKP